jgi:hypothetical protein
VRSSDGAPRSGRGDRRAEPSREPSPRLEPGGPVRLPGVPGGERTGGSDRPAGGRAARTNSLFFWQFCDIAKSDDDPQEDLAIFGYNLKMKAILIQKNPSILSSSLLEPCIKNMAIINQKFWKF